MPLVDHLRELRNRLMKAVGAILVVTIVAAFYWRDLTNFLISPLPGCGAQELGHQQAGSKCVIAVTGLLSPFTLALKVAVMTGVVAASPVWLYQLWAFVAPGLHRHEKKYTLAFLGAAIPLFLAGAWTAYSVLPTTVQVLQSFVPDRALNILPVDDFLNIATRMVVVFGLSFELPLFLIMLNFGGVLSARRMTGWWRAMVMAITVFAAVATPSTDPLSMCLLAAPIIVLYLIACGISWLNDRRRARRRAADPNANLSDEEASQLDLTPAAVAPVEALEASPEPVSVESAERLDDIT